MRLKSKAARKGADRCIKGLATLAALVGIAALGWILWTVAARGIRAFAPDFFTRLPTPPGMAGGGVGNAILGTVIITALASLAAIPMGLLAGIYLAEFGKHGRLGSAVRFAANVLMGVPSIIVGLFAYTILVLPMKNFSGYAGAAALAIIMLPVVTRTTEDMLSLLPNSLRESALALGAPRWKVTRDVLFRASKAGIITGVLLAVARVSGETAPLLFTALNSSYWPKTLDGPTANLTVTIFNFAMSPYRDWQQTAWGASLLIMLGVLALTILTRFVFRGARHGSR
jgi:phosphate transport system permease protein